jgi:hypothetical protein
VCGFTLKRAFRVWVDEEFPAPIRLGDVGKVILTFCPPLRLQFAHGVVLSAGELPGHLNRECHSVQRPNLLGEDCAFRFLTLVAAEPPSGRIPYSSSGNTLSRQLPTRAATSRAGADRLLRTEPQVYLWRIHNKQLFEQLHVALSKNVSRGAVKVQ